MRRWKVASSRRSGTREGLVSRPNYLSALRHSKCVVPLQTRRLPDPLRTGWRSCLQTDQPWRVSSNGSMYEHALICLEDGITIQKHAARDDKNMLATKGTRQPAVHVHQTSMIYQVDNIHNLQSFLDQPNMNARFIVHASKHNNTTSITSHSPSHTNTLHPAPLDPALPSLQFPSP